MKAKIVNLDGNYSQPLETDDGSTTNVAEYFEYHREFQPASLDIGSIVDVVTMVNNGGYPAECILISNDEPNMIGLTDWYLGLLPSNLQMISKRNRGEEIMYQTYWRDDLVKDPELSKPGTSYWLYGNFLNYDVQERYKDLGLEKYGIPLKFKNGEKTHALAGLIYFVDEGYPLEIGLSSVAEVLNSNTYQLNEPYDNFTRLDNWGDNRSWETGDSWIMLEGVKKLAPQTINFQNLPFRSQE